MWQEVSRVKREAALPEHLEGALVVDSGALPVTKPRDIRSLNNSWWKIDWPDDQNNLCLPGRPDLEVCLFLWRQDAERLAELKVVPALALPDAPTIVLGKGEESRELFGIKVYPGVDVPIAEILHPYFVVIARNPLSALTSDT